MNHKRVAKTIEAHQDKGWDLFSYQVTKGDHGVVHFLLFEKDQFDDYID
jgi:hypothetical protein